MSARYRKDEQALVQLPRRGARSPRRALGTATTVTSQRMAPLEESGPAILHQLGRVGFVACEDLQAEGYGAYRNLCDQAATSEGAKR